MEPGGNRNQTLWSVLTSAGFTDAGTVPGEPHGLSPIQMAYAVAKAETGGNISPGGNLFQFTRNPPRDPIANARRAFATSAGGASWVAWCTAFGGPRDPQTGARANCGHKGPNYLRTVGGVAPAYVRYANEAQAGAHGRGGQDPGASFYDNPLRGVKGLRVQRIDQGVDYAGTGPVYPIGKAHVDSVLHHTGWTTSGCADSAFVRYTLLEGPLRGRAVYVSECFRPTVKPGDVVGSRTPIGNLYGASPGIETGWADPGTRDSALAATKGGGYTEGECTALGRDFNDLMVAFGVKTSSCDKAQGGHLPPAWMPSAMLVGRNGLNTFGLTTRQQQTAIKALGDCSQGWATGGGASDPLCQGLAVKACVAVGGQQSACQSYVSEYVSGFEQRAWGGQPCQTFQLPVLKICFDKPLAAMGMIVAALFLAFGVYLLVRSSSGNREVRRLGQALGPLSGLAGRVPAVQRRRAVRSEVRSRRAQGAREEAGYRVSSEGRRVRVTSRREGEAARSAEAEHRETQGARSRERLAALRAERTRRASPPRVHSREER